jgi:acylphosphatase
MTAERRVVRVGISGRVQGVWFRDWTRRTASSLGLAGWVRNRRDGSVEALFAGSPLAVATMLAACREGPPLASVARIDILEEGGSEVTPGFDIRSTA